MYEIEQALDEIYKFLDYDPTIEGWKFERTKNAIKVLLSKSTLTDLYRCVEFMVKDIAVSNLAPKICAELVNKGICEENQVCCEHFDFLCGDDYARDKYLDECIFRYYSEKIKLENNLDYESNINFIKDFANR